MKSNITLGILAAFTLLVGCATQHRGSAYGHEQEFRQQIADSKPVKDLGYKIQDLRFSDDYHKVLVVFATPGKPATQEVVLEDDGFRRYAGSILTLDPISRTFFTVTIPDK
jgi:hypothetical protein